MSNFRNLLARRDASEGSPTGHEQTRKVELALRSLNPSVARQQHQQSRGLSHRSSVPSFFHSSVVSTKGALRQRRVRQSPPPALNAHHSVQLCSMMAVNSPTSPVATLIPGQNYLPLPTPLPLDLPFFPLATPPPPPPATRMRRRFSMLSRKFGEPLSPELVFDADPTDVEPKKACGGMQKNTFPSVARATNEGGGGTCDLYISSTDGRSEDDHRPSVQNAEGHIAQQKCTTWILEKNGQRITQYDYHEMLEFLRKL